MTHDWLTFKRERWPVYIVGACVGICLALLLTGNGILVSEEVIISDSSETVEISGVTVPAAAVAGTGYFCTYFSGRGTVKKYFSSYEGVRQCPFITDL